MTMMMMDGEYNQLSGATREPRLWGAPQRSHQVGFLIPICCLSENYDDDKDGGDANDDEKEEDVKHDWAWKETCLAVIWKI